jgi:sphingomyelin phosphodiesterase acid-like 3
MTRSLPLHFAVAAALVLIAALPLAAQSPAAPRAAAAPAPSTIPALFLSDIHLDPFSDPAKVARLDAAPAGDWPAILAAPPSPTQPADFVALQQACPVRGIDTPNVLWQSSLAAIRANAAHTQFVTISGDLLAHSFDCKYRTLLPAAKPGGYLAFTEKTIQYIVATLRESLPGVPIYVAMGNNDSGCGDYQLDSTHDAFLAGIAPIVAGALPADLSAADRAAVLSDFAAGGYFSVPLASVPHTRIVVLDDLFFSPKYATCSGKHDPASAAAQLAWLADQLTDARTNHEKVWVIGHIPPGVDLYATAKKLTNVCTTGKPQMFLASEDLPDLLARNPDVVSLALFGHTHSDELRLLTPEQDPPGAGAPHLASEMWAKGVPLKVVASITPVNGNNPSFTLARVDPSTATLVDYTVILASNQTGIATTWAKEYTYSAAYREPAFNSAALTSLIAKFRADPIGATSASRTYLTGYSPRSDVGQLLKLVWPQYVCSMDHDSSASFAACACAAAKP